MPKIIDLTGQVINGIEVLGQDSNQNNRVMWRCKCHCGNIFSVEGYALRSGHTKSCGCKSRKKQEIPGTRYGLLTILGPAEDRNGCAYWHCKCECGKELDVKGASLRSGKTKSCGCARIKKLINYNQTNNIIDLTNQKFGHLTILGATEKRAGKQVIWKCQCDCGNITYVRGSDLRTGNTKSCGCQRNKSYGEEKIKNILTQNKINFSTEKMFDDLIFPDTNGLGRFDFYIENKYLIEYDGPQHTVQGNGVFDNEEKFNKTQEHDKYKNEWCKNHNIPLIRIPYTHYNDICLDDLLLETTTYLVE